MRVLQINKYLFPRDGVTTVVAETIRILRERGHEITAFGQADARNFTTDLRAAYVPSIELDAALRSLRGRLAALARIFWGGGSARALARFVDETRPDVAHVHNIYHHLSPRCIAVLARRGIPVVMTLHDYKLFCPDYLFLRPTEGGPRPCTSCLAHGPFDALRFRCVRGSAPASLVCFLEALAHRRLWSMVDAFIAPSAFMARSAIAAGIPRRKIALVRNPAPRVAPPEGERAAEPARILFLGRLYPEKGARILVEAFARAETHGATLVVAGDGPERPALEALAKSRGLAVEFPGFLQGDAKARALASARALAFPSAWHENCPMAILEAFACGTPVVASAVGGIPELVIDGTNGLLVPPGNVHALAEKISAICVSSALAARLGQSARASAASEFGDEMYARDIVSTYAHACRDRRRHA